MDSRNESMFLRISYTNPATLIIVHLESFALRKVCESVFYFFPIDQQQNCLLDEVQLYSFFFKQVINNFEKYCFVLEITMSIYSLFL